MIGAKYVIDRDGHVWLLVHDGGMVMRANESSPTGVTSAGIDWLKAEHGPLVPFDAAAYHHNATRPAFSRAQPPQPYSPTSL